MSLADLWESMKCSPSILPPTPHPVRFVFSFHDCSDVRYVVTTDSVDLFQQTTDSLTFDGTSLTQCYEVTFNFDVENICEHFDCRGIQLESTLTTADESARVHINTSTAVVIIELPENCTCTNEPHTLSNSNDNNFKTVTAIISSLVVVIVILAVVVLGMLCYRKSKKKDRLVRTSSSL